MRKIIYKVFRELWTYYVYGKDHGFMKSLRGYEKDHGFMRCLRGYKSIELFDKCCI
jgi:hypothetical protein